jgi:hypothetical protein
MTNAGSLHCAVYGETLSGFGRDNGIFAREGRTNRNKATAKAKRDTGFVPYRSTMRRLR